MSAVSLCVTLFAMMYGGSSAWALDELQCTAHQAVRVQLEITSEDSSVEDAVQVRALQCTDDLAQVGYHVTGIDRPFANRQQASALVYSVRTIMRYCEGAHLTDDDCTKFFRSLAAGTLFGTDARAYSSAPLHNVPLNPPFSDVAGSGTPQLAVAAPSK